MPYVLISPESAEDFNRALCRLMRPTHLRDDSYVTDLYCPMHEHPSNGWMALELPDIETVPIHVSATGEELLEVMQTFVQKGSLTSQEATGIAAAIGVFVGQAVRIADFVPPSWQANVKTKQQMEADGWWPSVEQQGL